MNWHALKYTQLPKAQSMIGTASRWVTDDRLENNSTPDVRYWILARPSLSPVFMNRLSLSFSFFLSFFLSFFSPVAFYEDILMGWPVKKVETKNASNSLDIPERWREKIFLKISRLKSLKCCATPSGEMGERNIFLMLLWIGHLSDWFWFTYSLAFHSSNGAPFHFVYLRDCGRHLHSAASKSMDFIWIQPIFDL